MIILGGGGLGEGLNHEGRVLMIRISALIRETSES